MSVHFLLDLDGTIYQTLDLKERAWHATSSNGRSVGIEIANIGAYGVDSDHPLDQWYGIGEDGKTRVTLPGWAGESGIRTENFVARPARDEPVVGTVQRRELIQYDLTPEQYDSLVKLTAALCEIFPKIRCDYPRDESGKLVTEKLPDDVLENYGGLIGHFHIQSNKVDPGPAFNWEYLVKNARAELGRGPEFRGPRRR